MFTVCPKCALTLVVTAADLRVAQGYVRCGRCSNVFNALSRLSEDRQPTPAAAQPSPEPTSALPPKPASPPPPADPVATSRSSVLPDPASTSRSRVMPDPTATARAHPVSDLTASRRMVQPPPPPSRATRYDDDSLIPEEDLEFKPDATDLNKVFVEPTPSPEFTAATGTFNAIRLGAQEAARAEEELARTSKTPVGDAFDPVDTQVDVEIDPELLATMAQLTHNRLERLNPTPEESEFSPQPVDEPAPASQPTPVPTASANSTSATGTRQALVPPQPATPAKQSMVLQPPMAQQPQPPVSMRLAERAKARAEAAPKTRAPEPQSNFTPGDTRGTPMETAAALRDALAPRKRPAGEEMLAAADQPTSFSTGLWTTGSAVLVLMLLLQIVHHYRHDLAANATFNGPLTSVYAMLGIPIVPRWDLSSYEVHQLGASTSADAPGQITVRASVKNGAHQAQPLPFLRVTLQDRFGNRIASRDVPAQSYLPRAIPRTSLLSAGQRIDAEMAFVDPGSNAVGFEIDACLPAPGGGISCANDAAR